MLLPGQDDARARMRYERESSYAAALLGRRPRRATAWPGIFPAQASQRSACFDPRRASVKLIRMTAPFASSTSLPQLSHTSLVTRATDFLLEFGVSGCWSLANVHGIRLRHTSAGFSDHSGVEILVRSYALVSASVQTKTIVVLEGDDTGQELLEESLRVLAPEVIGLELEFPRFDLSLEARRETQNGVVHAAARAIREL